MYNAYINLLSILSNEFMISDYDFFMVSKMKYLCKIEKVIIYYSATR